MEVLTKVEELKAELSLIETYISINESHASELRRNKLRLSHAIATEQDKRHYTKLDTIMSIVSLVWGLSENAIARSGQTNYVARARHCYCYYANKQGIKKKIIMKRIKRHVSVMYNSLDKWQLVIDYPSQWPDEHYKDIEVRHLLKENNIL